MQVIALQTFLSCQTFCKISAARQHSSKDMRKLNKGNYTKKKRKGKEIFVEKKKVKKKHTQIVIVTGIFVNRSQKFYRYPLLKNNLKKKERF